VNAIVFGASLEEDAGWLKGGEGKGGEEVAEKCRWRGKLVGRESGKVAYRTVNIYELLGIGPRFRAWFGFWLGVRIEENDVGTDFGVSEGFGDILGLGEEVRGDMLDTGTMLFGQKGHHLRRRRAAGDGIYFLPASRRLKQNAHGVESGDSIGASDDCG
jgi:hypothetical protein